MLSSTYCDEATHFFAMQARVEKLIQDTHMVGLRCLIFVRSYIGFYIFVFVVLHAVMP